MPLANAAAKRALDIDPASQEAQAVLGMVAALYDFDWTEAERRFRLAISCNLVPAYVRWYYSYSYLLPVARTRESIQQCVLGLKDDPLNFMGGFHYAGALLAGGHAEAGENHLHQLSEVHSNLYQPHYLLALSQAVRGLREDALTAAEKAYSLAPWSTTTKALFAGLLKHTGQASRSNQLLDELCPDQYGVPMGLSLFYMGSSEMDQAAEWAEKAVEQRDTRMILLIAFVRAFRPRILHSDSKWFAIARTLGIPVALLED
jgi:tetratricopeptide (TPR) repeat protein